MKSSAYVLSQCEGDVNIETDDGHTWEITETRDGLKITVDGKVTLSKFDGNSVELAIAKKETPCG